MARPISFTCESPHRFPTISRRGWELNCCRYPFVAVCIGLAIKKKVVVGVVYNPVLEEKYTGIA